MKMKSPGRKFWSNWKKLRPTTISIKSTVRNIKSFAGLVGFG